MKKAHLLAVVVSVVIATTLGACDTTEPGRDFVSQVRQRLGLDASSAGQATPLVASGILEARTVTISSDMGGRITALHVAEGDLVENGQPLLALDDSLPQAQRAQAEAAIAVAQAQLDLLRAGARPEQIDLAQLQVQQAEAAAAVARQTWDDARLLRDNPQELDVQISEAETALARASHAATAARFSAEAADLQTALWGRITEQVRAGVDVSLPTGSVIHMDNPAERDRANTQWNLSSQQAWEAWQLAYQAEEAGQVAATALADLRAARARPLALNANVHQAEAASHAAAAAVDWARAGLMQLQAGARPQQIALAQEAVDQARAALAPLDVQLAKTRIYAPGRGLVTDVAVRPGEVAVPGASLLEIADLAELTLIVYVPQSALGQVWLGQAVAVTVDAYPDRAFAGLVTRIADQAEFALRGMQTEDARASAVFAVEISLPNADGLLKPGMPADARFVSEHAVF